MSGQSNSSQEFTNAAARQDSAPGSAESNDDYQVILKLINTNAATLDNLLKQIGSGVVPPENLAEIAQKISVCRDSEKQLIKTAFTKFQVTEQALKDALFHVREECDRVLSKNSKLNSELADAVGDRAMLEQELFRRDEERRVEVEQITARLTDTETKLHETQEQRDKYHDAAYKDDLTGLPNRTAFIEGLVNRVQDTIDAPDNLETAVVFIDLDGFKALNDNCGHKIGDAALIEIGQRLQKEFARKGDMVARLGGDEMVIFISYDDRKFQHEHICQKVRDSLFGLYFEKEQEIYPVGASIGISMLDKTIITSDPLKDQVSKLLSEADEEMYRDKWGVDTEGNVLIDNEDAPKYRRLKELKEAYAAFDEDSKPDISHIEENDLSPS